MKRKYYMRGLGVGILLTTLVFSFLNMSEPTEEEIRKKAEELGYVLPEPTETPGIDLDELMGKETPKPTKALQVTNSPEENLTSTPIATPTVMLTPSPEPALSSTPVPTIVPSPETTKTPEEDLTPVPTHGATETPVPTNTVAPTPTVAVVKAQIHIAKGNTGTQVCRMIAEAGIVEDAEELRLYIRRRNLIDDINVGTFELSSDMSFEEITKIITGK